MMQEMQPQQKVALGTRSTQYLHLWIVTVQLAQLQWRECLHWTPTLEMMMLVMVCSAPFLYLVAQTGYILLTRQWQRLGFMTSTLKHMNRIQLTCPMVYQEQTDYAMTRIMMQCMLAMLVQILAYFPLP